MRTRITVDNQTAPPLWYPRYTTGFSAPSPLSNPRVRPSVLLPTGLIAVQLDDGKILSAVFDDESGRFVFKSNYGNEDKYDVDFERVLPNGTEQDYETDDIETGKVDSYEMDFGKWDGKSDMCFRDDDDGNGFANDECEAQSEEDNDDDADDADDEADDEDSDVDNDGKLNDVDTDDDGDGTPDDKDTDDDNDGESDSEDDDDNEDEDDGDDKPGILSFLHWRWSLTKQWI